MMKRIYPILLLIVIGLASCGRPKLDAAIESGVSASIFPDYSETTFPSNIAAPNFIINDKADDYFVVISADNGPNIEIRAKDGNIQIPLKKWHKLQDRNKGKSFTIDIYMSQNNKWQHYTSISNQIAEETLDSYLVYRWINPANIIWRTMGIYQRNIENYEVSPIMSNTLTDNNCMHCHTFAANNSENFMLHMRGKPGGTVIYYNDKLKFVDTRTEHTISAGGYPSWHPSGKLIAFSTNKIHQQFHTQKEKYAFVFDLVSDIVLYNVEKNQMEAIPKLSTNDFENIPIWSYDGKFLYFLNAPEHKPDTADYKDIKYSLKRISYDIEKNTWGEIENIIMADSVNKSIAFPRPSPDNRYVIMCMADYGYFTVYNETSDIAILDLKTGEIMHPDINSNNVESYPSWSSNGKWIMFNSKRDDGVSSRPYFAYFDNGNVAKPFLLPQEDAMWNFEELNNINRPELIKTKLQLNPQQILKLVQQSPEKVGFDMSSLEGIENNSNEEKKSSGSVSFDQ